MAALGHARRDDGHRARHAAAGRHGKRQRDAGRGVGRWHGRGSGFRRGPSARPGGRAAHGVEPRPAPAAGSTIGGHMTEVLQAPGYRHALMRYCQLPGLFGPGRTNDVRAGS